LIDAMRQAGEFQLQETVAALRGLGAAERHGVVRVAMELGIGADRLADVRDLLRKLAIELEMTEESFGELANKHSDDQNGKVTNGGLYEDVEKGKMVEPFDNWIFDEVRIVGDYGIVKTQYGYHIMYFSGIEDIWYAQAKSALISDEVSKVVEAAIENHPIDVDYKKIVLAVVKVG
jgi:hypothetical protein